MKTGYPRFFIPRVVDELAQDLVKNSVSVTNLQASGPVPEIVGMLFPHYDLALEGYNYLAQSHPEHQGSLGIIIYDASSDSAWTPKDAGGAPDVFRYLLHLLYYPAKLAKSAKAFWQHTGYGISTRQACWWKQEREKYDRKKNNLTSLPRFHKLPFKKYEPAKLALTRRIAALYSSPSSQVPETDIFLFPTGMSAISKAALAAKSFNTKCDYEAPASVAVFGFLYVDTFKVLTKIHSITATLYKFSDSEIDRLESSLRTGSIRISALFTEFPGNPLLQCPDLARLYRLSHQYGFLLIVDDTVGTSVNLSLLASCDVVVTSLTKMFSGGCNVMGGSVVLNPQSSHIGFLRWHFASEAAIPKPDPWFPADLVQMEKNSADFESRVRKASANAEMVVDLLRQHQNYVVKEVYYPKGSPTQSRYEAFLKQHPASPPSSSPSTSSSPPSRSTSEAPPSYGFLLSILFRTPQAAIAFYDALEVAKGPSLGTNFTLACAYTLLAHYSELQWAAQYGVVEHLVRISVGLEEAEWLLSTVKKALLAAGEAAFEAETGIGAAQQVASGGG
jgi:cystathionine gamma-synthase